MKFEREKLEYLHPEIDINSLGDKGKENDDGVEAGSQKEKKSRIWMLMFLPILVMLLVVGVQIYRAHIKDGYCNSASAFASSTNTVLQTKSSPPIATVKSETLGLEAKLATFVAAVPSQYKSQALIFQNGMNNFFNAGYNLYVMRKQAHSAIDLAKLPDKDNPIKEIMLLDQKLKTPSMQAFAEDLLSTCHVNIGVLSKSTTSSSASTTTTAKG